MPKGSIFDTPHMQPYACVQESLVRGKSFSIRLLVIFSRHVCSFFVCVCAIILIFVTFICSHHIYYPYMLAMQYLLIFSLQKSFIQIILRSLCEVNSRTRHEIFECFFFWYADYIGIHTHAYNFVLSSPFGWSPRIEIASAYILFKCFG